MLQLDGVHPLARVRLRQLITRDVGQRGSTRSFLDLAIDSLRQTLLPPEIVFIVAGKHFNAAVADLKDSRGQLVDEIAVVGDEDYGPYIIL